MKLKRIATPAISHYAYLVTDGEVAALVDPRRDVDEYLQAARELGCRITHVLETHRQEDFVMGSAHLKKTIGAVVVNGKHELFGRGDQRLDDGEHFMVGDLKLQAFHTPGHTPESMCYVLEDPQTGGPWAVFSGDTLFFGDTGRTDLTDEDKSEEYAGLLYDSVHGKLAPLGDNVLVLPAHGPGSVCGTGMAERPGSTLGAEKKYNPVFTMNREKFTQMKGQQRLPRPPFFRHMEQVNLEGGLPPIHPRGQLSLLTVPEFAEECDGNRVYDTREPEAYAGGHIAGSYSIWRGGLPVFGGWFADHETPVLLLGDGEDDVDTATRFLSLIGIDNIRGGLAGGFANWRKSGQPIEHSGVITPRELLDDRDGFQVVDVREPDEYASGHIPGASAMYVGELEQNYQKLSLDQDRPVVVTCGVGHRAGIGVSILLRQGFTDVRNLLGGMNAWQELDLPLEKGD